MTLRLQNMMLAALLALTTLIMGFGAVGQNPMSGGYQLFEKALSGINLSNHLNALEIFAPEPENAPDYVNAPNRTGRGTSEEWIQGHNTATGYNRDNGIVGGHNQSAFGNELTAQGGRVTGRQSDPSMPGVETVSYQVAARDTAGNIIPGQYRNKTFNKTIYDPSVLSDQKVAQMSAQAGQRANFASGAREAQVAVDGYSFRVYRNPNTGEITNAHLVTP